MNKMSFNVKCVKDCLLNNGKVFTVRKWKAYWQESMVFVLGVGFCKKIRIAKVCVKSDVERYVKLSGFDNVDDWWNAVSGFNACDGWLYLVVRVKGGD